MPSPYDLITNVPPVEITDTGPSIPDTPSVLAGVLEDYRSAFGNALNITSLSTPQGYLAQETTAAINDVNAAIAYLYNNIDPAYASGRMQDAIARIYFISRKPPTYTVVTAICTGAPMTGLPAGSQAKADDGNIYVSTAPAVFGPDGTVEVVFRCTTAGPIACGVGELSSIAVRVGTWDAVTNLLPGAVGSAVENRLQFERRRKLSVAINSHSTPAAINANVFALDGVIDSFAVDNFYDYPITFGVTDYELKPHSVLVSVVGGEDQEIADKIWERKDPGCDMNGNVTKTVVDDNYLSNNKPTYEITFLRPTNTTVKFHVVLDYSASLPNNIETLVKEAITTAFNGGLETKDRERINGTIYASNYYQPVSNISAAVSIVSLLIGTGTGTADQTVITMGVDQFPVVDDDNIIVELANAPEPEVP